ncbi:UbiA family prenyltransferase [Streptococcus moroccensis]|uniref:4-hydroxybenzoate polyprenyltransferase n=1 Tax=Streptococcus moroccensis TaxID=1451356 RepID=A0ABT9YSS6_9STRE|nr:UbiA family prenyltransferase [Streptococcus moroccensis]MDQ0222393.1 4-hydroxybenzoate polyprenyltransferase [Streptococcus moroccensis]
MLSRLATYYKEMYPIIPRFLLAVIMFFEIYFVLLLNQGVHTFDIGIQEFVGIFTIFVFLMILRIADDFKDYETDRRLFPERALPSGRVKKSDLAIALGVVVAISVLLNILFMNNIGWFLFLYIYGTLMSFWFFQKDKIQNSLPMALVTHNPVMMVLNIYTISFVCYKYQLPLLSWTTVLLAFTMYFPSLIWEISRKIRAPKDETAYVTYSKLFGYQRVTRFVQFLTLLDILTNIALLWGISKLGVLVLVVNVLWMTIQFQQYIKDPTRFSIKERVERYTYITETTMVVAVALYLLIGRF